MGEPIPRELFDLHGALGLPLEWWVIWRDFDDARCYVTDSKELSPNPHDAKVYPSIAAPMILDMMPGHVPGMGCGPRAAELERYSAKVN